jgi:hypothetical protein
MPSRATQRIATNARRLSGARRERGRRPPGLAANATGSMKSSPLECHRIGCVFENAHDHLRICAPIILEPEQHEIIVDLRRAVGRSVAKDLDDVTRRTTRQIRCDVALNEIQDGETLGRCLEVLAQFEEFPDNALRRSDGLVSICLFQRQISSIVLFGSLPSMP